MGDKGRSQLPRPSLRFEFRLFEAAFGETRLAKFERMGEAREQLIRGA